MSASIIHFPVDINQDAVDTPAPLTCDQCIHFMSGYLGEYCRAYSEDIFNIHDAELCDQFEQAW